MSQNRSFKIGQTPNIKFPIEKLRTWECRQLNQQLLPTRVGQKFQETNLQDGLIIAESQHHDTARVASNVTYIHVTRRLC